jgi:hypothetical protein
LNFGLRREQALDEGFHSIATESLLDGVSGSEAVEGESSVRQDACHNEKSMSDRLPPRQPDA